MSNPGDEQKRLDSPAGWLHHAFWPDDDQTPEAAPGVRWRRWSERVEATSAVWSVRTMASRYRLDLREGTFVRTELQGDDRALVDLGLVPHNQLPGDATSLRLLAILECQLNDPMVLMVDLDGDDRRGTFRVTTPVVAIHPELRENEGHT